MREALPKQFFIEPSIKVAKNLLGKFLVRKWPVRQAHGKRGKEIAAMITEVEVYDGFKDKASHASRGLTTRNAPMFGPAGHWYIYFTYGMHWMLNIVTGARGYPAAILIRGAMVVPRLSSGTKNFYSLTEQRPSLRGVQFMRHCEESSTKQSNNSGTGDFYSLSSSKGYNTLGFININGPARLTKFFHIDKKFNALAASRKTGLWIEDRGVRVTARQIKKGPRIGVDYAGPEWVKKKLKFFLSN